MRLVKFTQVNTETGDTGSIWVNPDHVARVFPKENCAVAAVKVPHHDANTRISVASTAQGVAFWVKETPDEVVAALTSATLAARLAAKI